MFVHIYQFICIFHCSCGNYIFMGGIRHWFLYYFILIIFISQLWNYLLQLSVKIWVNAGTKNIKLKSNNPHNQPLNNLMYMLFYKSKSSGNLPINTILPSMINASIIFMPFKPAIPPPPLMTSYMFPFKPIQINYLAFCRFLLNIITLRKKDEFMKASKEFMGEKKRCPSWFSFLEGFFSPYI